ncbi:MAG: cell division protein FtsZ [Chthoniobacteraceae bacterium]
MIALPRTQPSTPELTIKVIGLGNGGANALDRIRLDGFDTAELIAMNTDARSLVANVAPLKVQLGIETTRGLGTGGDPELGYAAAEEAADEIKAALDGADLVFLCAGLGGGTASGAAPLIANFARQEHALVIAFVTLPFAFERQRRMAQAEEALASLRQQADVVICFENDRMADGASPRAGIEEPFAAADQVISQSVRAIASILQRRGLIHAGFAEIAAALRAQNPRSLFGYGEADGDNRAHVAIERALRSPLMDRGRLLSDVQSILVHVAGGPTMTLNEVTMLMEELNRHINDTTRLLFSTAVDPRLGGKMSVSIMGALGGLERVVEAQARPAMVLPPPVMAPMPEHTAIVAPPAPVEAPVPAPAPLIAADAEPLAPAAEARPARPPKAAPKPKTAREEKQEQMTFEPVNRGRFEKSEPTIVDGQDLDVPAFMRMNVRVK